MLLIGEGESFLLSVFHHHHQRLILLCLGGTGIGMFSPFIINTTVEEEQEQQSMRGHGEGKYQILDEW